MSNESTVKHLAIILLAFLSDDSRGVKSIPADEVVQSVETFDPKQSAGLFVGVRLFPHDPALADVRYAVDDAIDLAFVMALDERVRLIEPVVSCSRCRESHRNRTRNTDSRDS